MDKISVIIAAYNAEDTLPNCVASVCCQTHHDIEIIIVDDCSTDTTVQVAKSLAATNARIKVIAKEKNGGPAETRNIALDAASGDWIAIVDSDDAILPERFEKMIACAKEHSVDVVFDNLLFITNHGTPQETSRQWVPTETLPSGTLDFATFIVSHRRGCPIPVLGFLQPLIRRSVLEKYRIRYNQRLRVSEDSMLIYDLYIQRVPMDYIDTPYYQYLRRKGSLSHTYNVDNIRSFDEHYRVFLEKHRSVMSPVEITALEELIEDNYCNMKAKEVWNAFEKGRNPLMLIPALKNFRTGKFLLITIGSQIKKRLK